LDVDRAVGRLRRRRFDYPPVDLQFAGDARPDLCVGLVAILVDFLEDLGGDAPPGATVRVMFSATQAELVVTISLLLQPASEPRGLPPILAKVLFRLLRSTLPTAVNYRCYENRMIRLGGELRRGAPGAPVQFRVPNRAAFSSGRPSAGN
jgi:hypothetical protein